MRKPRRAGTTFLCFALTALGTQATPGFAQAAGPVPEDQMEQYCQNVATAEFDTQLSNVATQPAQRRGTDFVIIGRSPPGGYDVSYFECLFGKRGMWKGFKLTGRGQGDETIPQPAKDSCLDMFAERAKVTSISPLRPGYWEVIMQSAISARSVACTVGDDGEIQEWTALN